MQNKWIRYAQSVSLCWQHICMHYALICLGSSILVETELASLWFNVMKRRKKIPVFDTNRYKKATENGAFAWRLSYFYSFWFSFHLNFLLLDFWFFWMFINSNQASPQLPTCKRLKVKSKSTKQQWRDTTQCYCYCDNSDACVSLCAGAFIINCCRHNL